MVCGHHEGAGRPVTSNDFQQKLAMAAHLGVSHKDLTFTAFQRQILWRSVLVGNVLAGNVLVGRRRCTVFGIVQVFGVIAADKCSACLIRYAGVVDCVPDM